MCECRQNQSLAELGTINCSKWQLWHGPNARSICLVEALVVRLAWLLQLIVGHSSRMKAMSKISFVPAFFNINEPLILDSQLFLTLYY